LSQVRTLQAKAQAVSSAPSKLSKANASPQHASSAPSQSIPAGLTPREAEVLRLVAQGYTDRQISEALTITVRTVNTHVTNILNKIGCDNRTAAATFAAQHHLL
jgi:DNA-binding NarL/FixJ family response regulator